MGLDYDKLNSRIRDLKKSCDSAFDCTDGDKEVHVSGTRVHSAGVSYISQRAYILIEPKCKYYGGGMYILGNGLNTSGGKCTNHNGSGHSCPHSSYEDINIYYSTDDYHRGA